MTTGAIDWRDRALRAEAEHEQMAEAWRAECRLREKATADAAAWKKGVEDANRIAQEHAERADRLERELAEVRRPAASEGLPEERLRELERLAEKATPGPWTTEGGPGAGWGNNVAVVGAGGPGPDAPCVVHAWGDREWKRDAAFIASAREAVPALIAEVRRLRDLAAPPSAPLPGARV